MSCVQTLLFVLAFASLNYVQSLKTCNLTKAECTTKSGWKAFQSVLDGSGGLYVPLDPLYQSKLEAEYLLLRYKVPNSTLTGLKNCKYGFKLSPDNFFYYNEFRCPKLVLKLDYDATGILGPVEVDGKGSMTVTLTDYIILLDGKYRVFTAEKDNKPHFSVINYNFDYEPKGPMTVDIDGTLHSDPVKDELAKNYVTKNGNEIERMFRLTLMQNYMGMLIKGIDIYVRDVPYETIFQEE